MFKLGNQPILSVFHIRLTGIDEVKLRGDQYTLQHVKAFGIHNHLILDQWHNNCVYYVNQQWKVIQHRIILVSQILHQSMLLWWIVHQSVHAYGGLCINTCLYGGLSINPCFMVDCALIHAYIVYCASIHAYIMVDCASIHAYMVDCASIQAYIVDCASIHAYVMVDCASNAYMVDYMHQSMLIQNGGLCINPCLMCTCIVHQFKLIWLIVHQFKLI